VLPETYWIVPAEWKSWRPDVIAFESLAMNFIDVLRSADALITKPGYGSFIEAACSGVPVLYVPRHDWPEEIFLVRWLQQHGRSLSCRRDQLEQGEFTHELATLLTLAPRTPAEPTGIGEGATRLAACFDHL
jgi:UDP-N-acetylglucosamine:LPS N-acetylglucosamine transferase